MPHALRSRLSIMMFLQYFVPGTIIPILSLYLMEHLHFSAAQIGTVFAVPALSSFIAPYFVSQLADRYISSERLLALFHALAAVLMLLLAQQRDYTGFLACYFAYALLFSPTLGLTNAIALRHIDDPRRDFGVIRVWGTAGWIGAAWLFGFLYVSQGVDPAARLPHALYACALSSVLMAVFSLSLPPSPKLATAPPVFLPWKVFHAFARPSLVVLLGVTFAIGIANQYFFQGASPYLRSLGLPDQYIMPAMSIGQICELFTVGFSGFLLVRFGIKPVLAFALFTQAARYLLLATHNPICVAFALSFQGLTFLFYTTAVVYVDILGKREERAGMQQLYNLVMSGCGNLAGSLIAGATGTALTAADGKINYTGYWIIPCIMALLVLAAFLLLFREEHPELAEPPPVAES